MPGLPPGTRLTKARKERNPSVCERVRVTSGLTALSIGQHRAGAIHGNSQYFPGIRSLRPAAKSSRINRCFLFPNWRRIIPGGKAGGKLGRKVNCQFAEDV